MSHFGIVLSSVFSANALLVYGFGRTPSFKARGEGPLASVAAIVALCALASALFWCLRSFVLAPLGLLGLDVFFYVAFVAPLLAFLAKALSHARGGLARIGAAAGEIAIGTLVFGIALIASKGGYDLPRALASSAGSGLGYWLATVLLEGIGKRLELSPIPGPFRGAPSMLVSAGLVAMALMGIDSILVRNLAG